MKDLLKEIVENKRVVVVGPSPHLEGKRLGSLIDSYDVVCRLNEIFPANLEKDYGSRTDVTFWNLCNAGLPNFKQMIKENPQKLKEIKLIVCPRNSLHVTPYHEGNFSPDQNVHKNYLSLNIKNPFFHIGNELNEKFESSIGCHPTVGALSILTILEYNIKKLYICGMSFFQTPSRYNSSKEKICTIVNGGKPPPSLYTKPGHDIGKEVEYLKSIIKNNTHISGDYYFKNIFYKNN